MGYTAAETRYETMKYRRCGESGLLLPAVSLGFWHNFGSVDNFENQKAMVRKAFDLGITHFDLANNYGPVYGSAEENFGRIMDADMAEEMTEYTTVQVISQASMSMLAQANERPAQVLQLLQ